MKNSFLRGLVEGHNFTVSILVDDNKRMYHPAYLISVVRANLNSSFKNSLLYKRRIIWATIIGVLFGLIIIFILGWGIYILLRRLHIIHHPRPANFEPFKEPKAHNSHRHFHSVLSGLSSSNKKAPENEENSSKSTKRKIKSKEKVDKKDNPLAHKRSPQKYHKHLHDAHRRHHHHQGKHRPKRNEEINSRTTRKDGNLDYSSESDLEERHPSGSSTDNHDNDTSKKSSLSHWFSSSRRNQAPENFIVVHNDSVAEAEEKSDMSPRTNPDSDKIAPGSSNDGIEIDGDDVNTSGVSLHSNLTPPLSSTSKKFSNLTSYHSLVSNCHISSSSSSAKSLSVSSCSSSSISIQLQEMIDDASRTASTRLVQDVEVGWDTIYSADEHIASTR